MLQIHPTTGIDPYAGPLSIIACFDLLFGLLTWSSAIWVKRKGGYMERFIQQRVYWGLGAILIFTSSFFLRLVNGV